MSNDGVERLRFLLSGIVAAPQNAPTNAPIPMPNSHTMQPSSIPQSLFLQPNQFNADLFRNEHLERVKLIKRLVKEQEDYVEKLLVPVDNVEKDIKRFELELEGLDIIQSVDSGVSAKKRSIKQDLVKAKMSKTHHLKDIQMKLNEFRRYQQDTLKSAGFPLFKVSDEVADLVNQYWVLAPYLATGEL